MPLLRALLAVAAVTLFGGVAGLQPADPPPVCTGPSWVGTIVSKEEGEFFPLLRKTFRCGAILRNAIRPVAPPPAPPREIPPELRDAYLQGGEVELLEHYRNDVITTAVTKWNVAEWYARFHQDPPKCDYHNANYGDEGCYLYTMLRKYKDRIIGKRGVVLGSRDPWVEVMLLGVGSAEGDEAARATVRDPTVPNLIGANEVLTLEYGPIQQDHPRITTMSPVDAARMRLERRWKPVDFVVTFSSVEHSGLGRYGDPLLPCGDLDALAQLYCLSKPNATLFLGVPTNAKSSKLLWNAHRMYGPQRFQHLMANWKVEDMHSRDQWRDAGTLHMQPTFVATKLSQPRERRAE
eukprot:EG_transcript_11813